jgi:hypothetical protein
MAYGVRSLPRAYKCSMWLSCTESVCRVWDCKAWHDKGKENADRVDKILGCNKYKYIPKNIMEHYPF